MYLICGGQRSAAGFGSEAIGLLHCLKAILSRCPDRNAPAGVHALACRKAGAFGDKLKLERQPTLKRELQLTRPESPPLPPGSGTSPSESGGDNETATGCRGQYPFEDQE